MQISSSNVVGYASSRCRHSCWRSQTARISALGRKGRSWSLQLGNVRAPAIMAPSTKISTSWADTSVQCRLKACEDFFVLGYVTRENDTKLKCLDSCSRHMEHRNIHSKTQVNHFCSNSQYNTDESCIADTGSHTIIVVIVWHPTDVECRQVRI